jgi:hypothetical protein
LDNAVSNGCGIAKSVGVPLGSVCKDAFVVAGVFVFVDDGFASWRRWRCINGTTGRGRESTTRSDDPLRTAMSSSTGTTNGDADLLCRPCSVSWAVAVPNREVQVTRRTRSDSSVCRLTLAKAEDVGFVL